ncbi:hypothetical protein NECAME_09316 [Necator americanus]|uniref:Secreted protein n=1 Tax=Necator americanus TaxID=51031 RepID=W2TGA8_NECAM|nr:hypothetical protein NECAME_09316 [Necator americanus]ETN80221.1 hypothetical protein NECAME_09316 [Necator americanus]
MVKLMRPFLLICVIAIAEAGLFDIFTGRRENVHDTNPDPGDPGGSRGNPNLGEEVKIRPTGSENANAGDEIFIPRNHAPVNRRR